MPDTLHDQRSSSSRAQPLRFLVPTSTLHPSSPFRPLSTRPPPSFSFLRPLSTRPPVLHLPFSSSALPLHLFDTDLVCSPGASSVSSRSSLKVGGRSGPAGFPTSPRIKCSEAREVPRHTYDLEARTRSQVQPSNGLSVSSQPILHPPSRRSLFIPIPPSSPPPAPCFQNPASDGNPHEQKLHQREKNMPIYRAYWGFSRFCSAGIIKQCLT